MARLAADDHAEDVVVLDLRGRSPVTDYFLIATGGSDRQRRTVAEDAIELADANRQPVLGVSGLEQPDWVLVDMADIVVHVFEAETRRFYDLELLWGDAPKVRWKRRAAAGGAAGLRLGVAEGLGPGGPGTPGRGDAEPPDSETTQR